MIGCFPDPYPDELLYSLCARFHERVQYPNKKSTVRELFGDAAAKCAREDKQVYGEFYWHRLHQLTGVEVCPKHKLFLVNSQVRIQNPKTRHEFVAADNAIQLTENPQPIQENLQHQIVLRIAQDADWLIQHSKVITELEALSSRYRNLLADKDLATYNGRVRVSKLLQEFLRFYSPELLQQLQGEIDGNSQHNWLYRLVRSPKGSQHPIRHLLLIQFLGYTVESLRSNNPQAGRTVLRKQFSRVYTWLRRNDRDWLEANQPIKQQKIVPPPRIDWEQRDVELASTVKQAAQRLKSQLGRPIQITIAALAREAGHLALIQQHLDKLPLTEAALAQFVETREEFAVRRIEWVVNRYRQEGIYPLKWQLVRQAGQLKELGLPWGILPWLRLGQVFQNGQPIQEWTMGEEMEITVPVSSSIHLDEVGNVIPLRLYPLQTKANLSEQCLVTKSSGITIILPAIECIRAILAPNKSLAYGLLEPNYLERIILRNEIENKTLNLAFSTDIHQDSLTVSVVTLIARILYDPSFKTAWNTVYSERFLKRGKMSWQTSISLSVKLPILSSRWRVRAIRSGAIILILEILAISPVQPLPFQEIRFTHPNLKDLQITETSTKAKNQQIVPSPSSRSIDLSAQPPANSQSLRTITSSHLPILEPKLLKVTKLKISADAQSNQTTKAKNSLPIASVETISLSDRGIGGRVPAAEFQPNLLLPSLISSEDGLEKFVRAINFIQSSYPELKIDWEIQSLEKDILFALLGNKMRKYALVTIKWSPEKFCQILEFGRPDAYSIS